MEYQVDVRDCLFLVSFSLVIWERTLLIRPISLSTYAYITNVFIDREPLRSALRVALLIIYLIIKKSLDMPI